MNGFCENTPLETVILKLPENEIAKWKEMARFVTEKEGLIEWIPLKQTGPNCSEMIWIQFYDRSMLDKNTFCNIDSILNHQRDEIISNFPENQTIWNLIEKNEHDAIYEVLYPPLKYVGRSHVIVRIFLTKTGYHNVLFKKRNAHMNSRERQKWFKLLKENASVVPFQEEEEVTALSMMDRLKDSLDIKEQFPNWKKFVSEISKNGDAYVSYIPNGQNPDVKSLNELLEVFTSPNLDGHSLDLLFEIEKVRLQAGLPKEIQFKVLEKSSSEMIYHFDVSIKDKQMNTMVRNFLTPYGYYSIRYVCRLTEPAQQREMIKWQKKLKSIQLKSF